MAELLYSDMLSPGTRQTVARKVRVTKLGEGYSARARDGINANRQVWTLTWTQMTLAQKEALRVFFDDLGDVDSFEWTPFGQEDGLSWRTTSGFNATANGYNNWDVSVEIEQVFDA